MNWKDEGGYLRAALVRDSDPDELAERGIPQGPPNLDNLDWNAIKRDLHNELMRRGIHSWNDVQRGQNEVSAAVRKHVLKRIIALYREYTV